MGCLDGLCSGLQFFSRGTIDTYCTSQLPLLLNGPHKNPSTRVSNVSDPWIDQAFTGESIPSLDHSPKPEFGRTYGYEDFITQFNVVPVHKVEVDPSVAALLASHKVENDPAYLEDPEHYEDAVRRYSQVVEFGTGSDTRFYVAWTGPERGYGMFPRVPIVAGEPLGVYAGVVTNNSMNSAYAWGYNSDKQIKDEEGNLVGLVIDGRDRGNMLRFANHAKDPNSEAVILPWKNLWHVIYVAKRCVTGQIFD